MYPKKSRKELAKENLPISLELVKYRSAEMIPITRIAKKFSVPTPRVVALVAALKRSPETWRRLADHYGLTEEYRPPWVGVGDHETYQLTEHTPSTPTTPGGSQLIGRSVVRSLANQVREVGRVEEEWTPVYIVNKYVVHVGGEPHWKIMWSDGKETYRRLECGDLDNYQAAQVATKIREEIWREIEEQARETAELF